MHLEFLVEEPSIATVLSNLLPRIVGQEVEFEIHTFQGKSDLIKNLPNRLKGYRNWLPSDWWIVVVVDEDRQDCMELKSLLDNSAIEVGFIPRNTPQNPRNVLNRIAIEELEAWYFGDIEALVSAYPKVPITLRHRSRFRDPDHIAGGTWEALEKVLKNVGYHKGGLNKGKAARDIAPYMDPDRNQSPSFIAFRDGLRDLIGTPGFYWTQA